MCGIMRQSIQQNIKLLFRVLVPANWSSCSTWQITRFAESVTQPLTFAFHAKPVQV